MRTWLRRCSSTITTPRRSHTDVLGSRLKVDSSTGIPAVDYRPIDSPAERVVDEHGTRTTRQISVDGTKSTLSLPQDREMRLADGPP